MNEENNTPKNKWSRIFRKKWFFPAVYLTVAALLLTLVIWYQNIGNQVEQGQEEQPDDYTPVEHDEDASPVMDQQEIIQTPVEDMENAEIVTKYYDYNADQKEQEDAIVVFENRYYQSTGLDIASPDNETFDVLASLSGTVKSVEEDPLLGNVVTLKHEDKVTTHYASLGDVKVSADDEVKQGDVIGNAGESLFGKDKGTHLHFEIKKDGKDVNPESFFNQPLTALNETMADNNDKTDSDNPESDGTNEENAESGSDGAEENSDADADEDGKSDADSDSDSDSNKEDSESGQSDAGSDSDSNKEDSESGQSDNNAS